MTRELLKRALDALENPALPVYTTLRKEIRKHLAQPQAEPAAWIYPSALEKFQECETFAHVYSIKVGCPDEESVPLYTHPAASVSADLIPQDALFVCGQMGNHVTRVSVEQPAPVPAVPALCLLCPEVLAFANLMERELRNNDHKGGWKDDAPGRLLERAEEEMREFLAAFLSYPRDTHKYRNDLASEGADVANMLMMVLDACGALAAASPPVALTQDDIVELANNYDCSDIPGGQRWVFINALELELFAKAIIAAAHGIAPGAKE